MRRTLAVSLSLAALAAPMLRAQGAAAPDLARIAPIDLAGKCDPWNAKHLNGQEALLVPTVVLHVGAEGSVFVASQGNGNSAKAKGEFAVAGLEKARLQQIARLAYDDFVQRMRAAGYKVITWDEVRDDPEVQKMGRYKSDKDWGMPTKENNKVKYLEVTPTDEQAIDPPMQGYGWGFRKVAKDRNATTIVPEYTLVAPQMWGEKGRGYKSVSARVNVAPGMSMGYAQAGFMTSRGGGGLIKLKEYEPVADSVGVLGNAKDRSPRFANALSAGLSALGGGAIASSKAEWVLAIDAPAFEEALLRGTVSFNQAVAQAAAKEKK